MFRAKFINNPKFGYKMEACSEFRENFDSFDKNSNNMGVLGVLSGVLLALFEIHHLSNCI